MVLLLGKPKLTTATPVPASQCQLSARQRLKVTLPISASLRDRLPETPISGCRLPFWFHCLLGLALTRGLKQKANPEALFLCPARFRLMAAGVTVTTGVLRHSCCDDSDEYPLWKRS